MKQIEEMYAIDDRFYSEIDNIIEEAIEDNVFESESDVPADFSIEYSDCDPVPIYKLSAERQAVGSISPTHQPAITSSRLQWFLFASFSLFKLHPFTLFARGVGNITNLASVMLCIDPSFIWLDFMFADAPVLSKTVGVGNICFQFLP